MLIDMAGYFFGHAVWGQMRGQGDHRHIMRIGNRFGPGKSRGEFRGGRVAKKGQSAGTLRDQALGCLLAAQPIVRSDDTMALALLMISPNDHGTISTGNLLDTRELVGLANHEHAIDHAGSDETVQPVLVTVRDHAAEHEVIALLRQRISKITEQGHEERIGHLLAPVMAKRDGDADHAGSLTAQIAGDLIEAKAMLLGEGLDLLARIALDHALACERAADRAGGHACDPCQIGQSAHRTVRCGRIGRRRPVCVWFRHVRFA